MQPSMLPERSHEWGAVCEASVVCGSHPSKQNRSGLGDYCTPLVTLIELRQEKELQAVQTQCSSINAATTFTSDVRTQTAVC